jgi:hypothetical protein
MLGGSQRLSAAARTLAYLPGLRGTELGEAAGEFTEGAMVRQVGQSIPLIGKAVGPLLGTQLLSDRGEKRKRDEALVLPAEPVTNEESSDGRFTPLHSRRMGTFTPLATAGEPSVSHPAEMHGKEIEAHVSTVGAEVRSQAGQTKADRERTDYVDDMHGEEVEDRITTLGTTLGEGQTNSALERAAGRLESAADAFSRTETNATSTQPILGLMRVEGANNVAGVMGDFVSQMRVQRTLEDRPMTGSADTLTVTQGVARAMGVTPEAHDRAPIQGDVARLGLFGDQALRLGLNGTQAAQVIREVKLTPEGTLRPETRSAVVNQAHSTLNTGWDGAQSAVNALQRAAAMLPNSITARGTVSVPTIAVNPQVQVHVNAPERSGLDDALRSQAALAGSQMGANRSEGLS